MCVRADPARQQELTWGHRFRIIQGIGRGLLYLHEDSRQDWDVHSSVQFEGFGLRSGTVILYVGRVGLIRLNLATKEAVVVYHRSDTAYISQVCLHEMDLSSLLQTMKPLS